MGRFRTPNQKKAYNALNSRLNAYVGQVQSIYDMATKRMSELATSTGYDGSSEFFFRNYPEIAEAVKDVQAQFVSELGHVIMGGTSEEWRQSNLIQNLLADKVLKHYRAQVHGKRFKHYYQTNSDALQAFQQRRDRGLNLSDKLWGQAGEYTKEIEAGISTTISNAIEKGMSAITLSKRLSKYLDDYPSLKRDYWETYGKAANIHDCEYRSIRLARSEINMAYRTAEQTRWKQFDFIVGYEIKLSGSHPAEDICDSLAGRYPKDFVWTGWHPNDMCYAIPIIMSEEEYWNGGDRSKSEEMVKDVPQNFKEWIVNNRGRIDAAQERGTSPYFIKDNPQYMRYTAKETAEIRHAARTQEDIERITRAAKNRQIIYETGDNYPLKSLRRNAIKYGANISEFEEWIATGTLKINKVYDIEGWDERYNAAAAIVTKKAEAYQSKLKAIGTLRTEAKIYSEVGKETIDELDAMYNAKPIDVMAIKKSTIDKMKKTVSVLKDKWEDFIFEADIKAVEKNAKSYAKIVAKNANEDLVVNIGRAENFEIKGVKRNCTIYQTRGGVKIYVPEDLNTDGQHFTPHHIAEAISKLPEKLQASIKEVHLVDFENPEDAYWKKAYKNFTRSFATGGNGVVTFYRNTVEEAAGSAGEVTTARNTLYHETGHNIDRMMHSVSGRKRWSEAMSLDQKKSNLSSPTVYGGNSPSEDFAESMEWYHRDRAWFKKMFPSRYKILKQILG